MKKNYIKPPQVDTNSQVSIMMENKVNEFRKALKGFKHKKHKKIIWIVVAILIFGIIFLLAFWGRIQRFLIS